MWHPNKSIETLFLPLFSCVLLSAVVAPGAETGKTSLPPLNPKRIAEIAEHLPPDSALPIFYTPPFSNRTFWNKIAATYKLDSLYARADRAASTPPPILTRDLFEEFRKTGKRPSFEKPFTERTLRLGLLLFAEGLANDGKRLQAIERELTTILDEPSWAAPVHTTQRTSWEASRNFVDLAAAARAWDVAMADYLLGDKLPPALRVRIRTEVRERVLDPYLERIRLGDRRDFWWMNGTNNWNAICNGGVLAAGLLLSGGSSPAASRAECAELISAFEALTPYYLSGLEDDGFCEEGISYWVYGYGHYTMAAELVRLATSGYLDLLAGEKQKTLAIFDVRWQIVPGVFPLFGDVFAGTKLPPFLHDFATLRYGGTGGLLGSVEREIPIYHHDLSAHLYATCFDLSLPRLPTGAT